MKKIINWIKNNKIKSFFIIIFTIIIIVLTAGTVIGLFFVYRLVKKDSKTDSKTEIFNTINLDNFQDVYYLNKKGLVFKKSLITEVFDINEISKTFKTSNDFKDIIKNKKIDDLNNIYDEIYKRKDSNKRSILLNILNNMINFSVDKLEFKKNVKDEIINTSVWPDVIHKELFEIEHYMGEAEGEEEPLDFSQESPKHYNLEDEKIIQNL